MTIQKIIDLLKKEGIGSKQLVIEKLENLTYVELKKLERDIQRRIKKVEKSKVVRIKCIDEG